MRRISATGVFLPKYCFRVFPTLLLFEPAFVCQLFMDDGEEKVIDGFERVGAFDVLATFRAFAKPRSLAINFSNIGAMSLFASTGFPVSFARISA